MIYYALLTVFELWFRLVHAVSIKGVHSIPRTGGVIIAANHVSWTDPIIMAMAVRRRMNFIAKKELFRFRPFGFILRKLGAFPVNRQGIDRAALRRSIEVVSAGGALGIFPEGHRSKDGSLQEGHAGAALISIKTGAPIVPVAVLGLQAKTGLCFLRRNRLRVVIGEPLKPPDVASREIDRTVLREYTGSVMKAISDLMVT